MYSFDHLGYDHLRTILLLVLDIDNNLSTFSVAQSISFPEKITMKSLTYSLAFILLSATFALSYAQTVKVPNVEVFDEVTEELALDQERQEEAVVQLREIQVSLKSKIVERRELRLKLKSADKSIREDADAELEKLNSEIELLDKTFEQIAIGGIDLSVFGVKEEKFDLREELITVLKPLLENVKSLTEKPRKIKSLRGVISDKEKAKQASIEALKSLQQLKEEAVSKSVTEKLSDIEKQWQSQLRDLERESQLAQFQLSSLEGKDVPWFQVVKQAALNLIAGRGLTIGLVLMAAISVWWMMRGILWLIRKRTAESRDRSVKVHYRLAAYAYRMLTGLLISIAIMMVLYFRQDLLLLAIMVVIFIGAALALKNLLPKYIAEGKLLLNMGGVRERERVMYNGVPWQVSSLNMYSKLVNPEIRGGIRLPISHMHEMISRHAVGDTWFPSSEGDWVFDDAENLIQVIRQSVDMVELRDVNYVTRFMPTADYYTAGYPNISRAEEFRIAVRFGIDYATQGEDLEKIEMAFSKGIKQAFQDAPYAEHVLSVSSDFESAGDSSLNYLMLTKFKPEAAQYYNKIKRRIQRACVNVCSENDWGIPFPQLSVHIPESSSKSEE
ncbi:MAG: hypothetical protein ACI9WC_001651 [Arenicella sp.]